MAQMSVGIMKNQTSTYLIIDLNKTLLKNNINPKEGKCIGIREEDAISFEK